ncbi:Ca2+-dependent phosphoinositide-specific phospholipase C, partial [Bradyrhizobium sp. NBAIM08]|uniref:Ca2+-dependent phosphoinositide-specific phospholipase C n=1 Tax=Bradyrhizobium sp. NBAIM08 TaxID=2793815 RepID=UPI001CD6178B
ITPDDVRGSRSTLESAVLNDGWPTLGASRGKVMFLMDNAGSYRTTYLAGHPSLQGRVLFTNSNPGNADAAFVERNDAKGSFTAIQNLVRQGYMVRTRSDSPGREVATNDRSTLEAALASGAQWVSTDYPVAGYS